MEKAVEPIGLSVRWRAESVPTNGATVLHVSLTTLGCGPEILTPMKLNDPFSKSIV